MDPVVNALQLAISPVILISACGLLLLSMTNRLGRLVDRARLLSREVSSQTRDIQIEIILQRAKWIRAAILGTTLSVFFTLLLILSLFVWNFVHFAIAPVVEALFLLAVISLIVSLVYLLRDINASLRAMQIEVSVGSQP